MNEKRNIIKQEYQRTWCDYLTPCSVNPNIMVGEYECQEECPFFKSVQEEKKEFKPCDYSRYSHIYHGEVTCNIESKHENKASNQTSPTEDRNP